VVAGMRATVTRRYVEFLTFIPGLMLSAGIWAQPTVKDYADLPFVQWVSVSPSGNKLAFRQRGDDSDLVKIVDIEQQKVIAGVDVSSITPRAIHFVDEDKLILLVSEEKRIRGYRGLDSVSTAFVYHVKKNELRQMLVPGQKKLYLGQTGLGKILGLSEDGKYAYMPAFTENWDKRGVPPFSLMRVSLEEKGKLKIVEKGDYRIIDYFMDGKDLVIAREKYNKNKHVYSVEVPDGKKWRTIHEDDAELRDFSIWGIAPDRKSLVLLNEDQETGRVSCYTMSLADGQISGKLFSRANADIASVLTDVNRVVHGVRYAGFSPGYEFFDAELTRRLTRVQEMFEGESLWLTDWTPDWKTLIVRVEGSIYAGDYLLLAEGEKPRFVTKSRPEFDGENIHPILTTTYKARDGLAIPTLITVPNNKIQEMTGLPTIMMPHGGPESHDTIGFDWLAQALANAGYLVIQPQFRGSTGFGVDHLLAGRGQWGKQMQDDLTDAINTYAAEGVVDKNKVCIVGWSYGGYAALAGGAFDSDLYKCVVSVNGVSDLNKMLKEEKREDNRHVDVYAYWKDVIASGEVDKEYLREISPVEHAENFTAPVLLIYGNKDDVVNYRQSKDMKKALRKNGKPVEELMIKDEGHSFTETKNREETLNTIIDFVRKSI
jgi:dipeptidyl aminopeptidase/acylaminoacyl peptidase